MIGSTKFHTVHCMVYFFSDDGGHLPTAAPSDWTAQCPAGCRHSPLPRTCDEEFTGTKPVAMKDADTHRLN